MTYLELYTKYKMDEIEEKLGVIFEDKELLVKAMTHSSYNWDNNENYQRLEFLGDAVVQMTISDYLYRHFPEMKEGDMSKTRSALVSAPSFSLLVQDLGFENKIIRGKSMSGTQKNEFSQAVLADIFESIIGAIYLDKGYNIAREIIIQTVVNNREKLLQQEAIMDFKTKLQEVLQVNGTIEIKYDTKNNDDERGRFLSQLIVEGVNIGNGFGKTKKEAEQKAAKDALNKRK